MKFNKATEVLGHFIVGLAGHDTNFQKVDIHWPSSYRVEISYAVKVRHANHYESFQALINDDSDGVILRFNDDETPYQTFEFTNASQAATKILVRLGSFLDKYL